MSTFPLGWEHEANFVLGNTTKRRLGLRNEVFGASLRLGTSTTIRD